MSFSLPKSRTAFYRTLGAVVLIASVVTAYLMLRGPGEMAPVTWLTADGRPPAGIPDIRPVTELSLGSYAGTVAWSPDGRYLATSEYYDMIVRIWDTRNWRQLHKIRKKTAGANRMIFMPDSRTLIVSSVQIGDDRSALTLIDAPSGKIVRHVDGPNSIMEPEGWPMANLPSDFALNATGSLLLLNAKGRTADKRGVYVYDTTEWNIITKLRSKSGALAIAAGPDATQFITAEAREVLWLWQIPGGKQLGELATRSDARTVAITELGRIVVGRSGTVRSGQNKVDIDSEAISIWNFDSGEKIASAKAVAPIDAIAVSGELIVASPANRHTILYSAEDLQELAIIHEFSSTSGELNFSANGKWLAVAGDDRVLIYSIVTTGGSNGVGS